MRIESVRFDASGNATIVVTGGISFFLPLRRVGELPLPPTQADQSTREGKIVPAENPAEARAALEALARADFDFDEEDRLFISLRWIDEEERARRYAILLCAKAEQSSFGLAAKLASKGFSRKAALAAIENLKTERILDDERYARIWARGRAERRASGPALLAAELRSRGQGEDAIRGALRSVDFDRVLARAVQREAAKLDRGQRSKPGSLSPRGGGDWRRRSDGSGEPLDGDAAEGGAAGQAGLPRRDGRYWDELYRVLKRQGFDGEKIREEMERLRQSLG